MADDKELYDAIKIALVIGIIFSVVFILYMDKRIKKENAFSELYFEEHRDLPHKLTVNESRDISFALTNHELEPVTYAYEIDSKTGKYRENITLLPNQQAIVHYTIKPEEKIWTLNLTVNKTYNNTIDLMKDHIFAEDNEFNLVIDNTTLRHYLPISHNIADLGYVYHTNLTTKELEIKPFKKTYNETTETGSKTTHKQGELTLTAQKGELLLTSDETENEMTALKEPFIIKFYSINASSGEALEVHFWYEVN